jgi:hypothetical protein
LRQTIEKWWKGYFLKLNFVAAIEPGGGQHFAPTKLSFSPHLAGCTVKNSEEVREWRGGPRKSTDRYQPQLK